MKQPVQKSTLKEVMMAGLDDESLQRYKEELLGDLAETVKASMSLDAPLPRKLELNLHHRHYKLISFNFFCIAPFVEIEQIEIVCQDRPEGNIVLNLKKMDNEEGPTMHVADEYNLKEGSITKFKVTFKVHNDIVYGLKFCKVVRKAKVVVAKDEEVMGTFAPTKLSHVVELSPDETPSGFFKRTSYSGKAMIVDMDGIVHLQYNFNFAIGKNW